MKIFILMATFALTLTSLSAKECGANYTKGIGHLLKGESRILGDKESIKNNETTKDNLYSLTLTASGLVVLKDNKNSTVSMKRVELMPGVEAYVTAPLKIYPTDISARAEQKLIVVACHD